MRLDQAFTEIWHTHAPKNKCNEQYDDGKYREDGHRDFGIDVEWRCARKPEGDELIDEVGQACYHDDQ